MRYEDTSGTFSSSGTPEARDDADAIPAGRHGPATGNVITGTGTTTGKAGADSANGGHVVELSDDHTVHGEFIVDSEAKVARFYILGEDLKTPVEATAVTMHAEGAVLIEVGNTKVICTASVEDRVPPFLRNTGRGWVTAEYGMLPRATSTRTQREASAGKIGGRTQEIQRLIGRSLRSVTRLPELGERTIWVDCDVIQADGGTRTAAISGVWVALALAARRLELPPPQDAVAAVSVGIVNGEALLDLDYAEDAGAEVDMNVVMTGDGRLIEIQATAEKTPFTRAGLDELVDLAAGGIATIAECQRRAVAG